MNLLPCDRNNANTKQTIIFWLLFPLKQGVPFEKITNTKFLEKSLPLAVCPIETKLVLKR